MPPGAFGPIEIPAWAWNREATRRMLRGRDIAALLRFAQQYGGASQSRIAAATGMAQGRISEIANGKKVVTLFDVIERIADGLTMPDECRMALGLAPRNPPQADAASQRASRPADTISAIQRPWEDEAVQRREFMGKAMGLMSLPAIDMDQLRHVAAALENAGRYLDRSVVDYFAQQITANTGRDGENGPRTTLPPMLGIVAAIERSARNVKPAVRRDLLKVGARGAEFVGWLYRDVGMAEMATYWHDRAIEWAQESGYHAMQGYVLLKKSQAAWDQRDGLRMLTLAQAAQESHWRLPLRIRAEAAQQEARGHAMLGEDFHAMERKLEDARRLMAEADGGGDGGEVALGSHYNAGLLAMQTAIAQCEAGRPERAVAIYAAELAEGAFSRRDHGYFLALKGNALAMADEPDEACASGLEALAVAAETDSVRTTGELHRLRSQLRPWSNRPTVRQFVGALSEV
ncbi:helix-turn-helix domain-containing protein [Allonocardiopsis opalescens]|uniref:Helix-turn-helix protein n=1 Tax=Allonocardiopsis opalescens TaxID=1144618 RepID=A0A2T0QCL1_9ACTN|nr:helix-turn-helix domain-containing protein [Allonocardiopsis opalescens]PRY01686.1 hypothetical protein CLV72_101270 [Allonocardiopsis opalescens]